MRKLSERSWWMILGTEPSCEGETVWVPGKETAMEEGPEGGLPHELSAPAHSHHATCTPQVEDPFKAQESQRVVHWLEERAELIGSAIKALANQCFQEQECFEASSPSTACMLDWSLHQKWKWTGLGGTRRWGLLIAWLRAELPVEGEGMGIAATKRGEPRDQSLPYLVKSSITAMHPNDF
jgi:hypothetical protein